MPKGRKNDTGKLRFDLLPVRPLEQITEIYTYGANKYDDNNWRSGIQWGRIFSASMRHMWAFWRGEDNDSESGLPHLAHAAFGCLTLLEYMETHRELDDRAVAIHADYREFEVIYADGHREMVPCGSDNTW